MLQDAIIITKGLRDKERTLELSEWHEMLSVLIPDIELSQERKKAVAELQNSRNTLSELENRMAEEREKEKLLIAKVASWLDSEPSFRSLI